MSYRMVAPPPALRQCVDFFWSLEGHADEGSPSTFTVMPNGQPGLIFQQRPDAFTGFDGKCLPQLFVFGQATSLGHLRATGSYRQVGVSFQPSALRSVLGLSAIEMTDRNIRVTDIFSVRLPEQLLECQTEAEQFSCLSNFLLRLLRADDHETDQVNFAVTALKEGKKLSFIQQQLGISERSLERLFLNHVGMTPMLYGRISRFQRALAFLRQGKYRSLTDVAYLLGFFDQSHFIRDFRWFSGVSPRVYLQKAVERMPGFPEWQQ